MSKTITTKDGTIFSGSGQAMLSSKVVRNAKLIVYEGGAHGICTTEKDCINAELVAFSQSTAA